MLVLAAASGCRRQEIRPAQAAQPAAVQAAVLKIEAQSLTVTVPITGTLVASTRVDIKAQTVGRVVRFDKMEGDAVSAGEPVVWVDEENYKLAARQAESAVQVAEAALVKARVLEAHSRSERERADNLITSGGITDPTSRPRAWRSRIPARRWASPRRNSNRPVPRSKSPASTFAIARCMRRYRAKFRKST
jgi:multidrug efflux pump subunit AcrA (membrane-fusion protein)